MKQAESAAAPSGPSSGWRRVLLAPMRGALRTIETAANAMEPVSSPACS